MLRRKITRKTPVDVRFLWGPPGIYNGPGFNVYMDDDDNTKFHRYCSSGFMKGVIGMLKHLPDPMLLEILNKDGMTALHLAVVNGHKEVVRLLVTTGAGKYNTSDFEGNAAMHLACSTGQLDSLRALVMPVSNEEWDTARQLVGRKKMLQRPTMLADLEVETPEGDRCLHLAARSGNVDIMRYLIRNGADINAPTGQRGVTVLHIAVEYECEEVFNFLLKECSGLDLEVKSLYGLTAYQFGYYVNRPDLQEQLRSRGAIPRSRCPGTKRQNVGVDYEDEDESVDSGMDSHTVVSSSSFSSLHDSEVFGAEDEIIILEADEPFEQLGED